jgi:membrane dipeptidase
MSTARELHQSAIVIDATCPLLADVKHLERYKRGGLTAVAPTVGGGENAETTLRKLGQWHRLVRERDDLLLIQHANDVLKAKEEDKLGIIFHFQGTEPIEDSLDLVDAYKALGVGIIQLSYNVKNRVGDGCEERTDAGLSRFGLKLIERMNAARVIVDCSHTGFRTTMEAIEASELPPVFSHAGVRAVRNVPRNIVDEQIVAVARKNGLVGIVGFPPFVADKEKPSLEDYIAHIDYVVQKVGVDHVALGIDYFTGQHPIMSDSEARSRYEGFLSDGRWSTQSYPPPPYYYPQGIEVPDTLHALTEGLIRHGYSEAEIRKILGENWLRVYRSVWGD